MEWRCEWCHKPQEENDPPCENCGHGSFERIVVQKPDIDRDHVKHEWVCQECGRGHPKHSPPCSRCGHTSLQREEVEYDLSDTEAASYLELGKGYVAAAGVLVLLAGLVATGVLSVPGIGGPPVVEDAPGDGERAAGVDLVRAEAELTEQIDARRSERGLAPLAEDEELAAIATYHNRHSALAMVDDEVDRPLLSEDYEKFDYRCQRHPAGIVASPSQFGLDDDVDAYESGSELALALDRAFANDPAIQKTLSSDHDAAGVDLYVDPDGSVRVVVLLC